METKSQEEKNNFQRWYAQSTPDEKKALAERMGTSLATLRQAAGAWRSGGRTRVAPTFARALEEAMADLGHPRVDREELCPACGACDLARIARKATR